MTNEQIAKLKFYRSLSDEQIDNLSDTEYSEYEQLANAEKTIKNKPKESIFPVVEPTKEVVVKEELVKEVPKWKQSVLKTLDAFYDPETGMGATSLFETDLSKLKMKPGQKDFNEKLDFLKVMKALQTTQDPEQFFNAIQGTKLANTIKAYEERKGFAGEDPSASKMIFPTLEYRTEKDKDLSVPGKLITGLFDILNLPGRAITAAAGEFGGSPEGRALDFSQRMARPSDISTPAESFVDFLAPSIASEKAIGATGKLAKATDKLLLGGKITKSPVGRVLFGKAPDIGEAVTGPFRSGAEPLKTQLGKSVISEGLKGLESGVRSGVAGTLLPSAVTLYGTDENAKLKAATELALGPILGGAVGAVGGAGKGVAKWSSPDYAKELSQGYGSIERFIQDIADEPVEDVRAGISTIEGIKGNLKQVKSKIGQKRDELLRTAKPSGMQSYEEGNILDIIKDMNLLDYEEKQVTDYITKLYKKVGIENMSPTLSQSVQLRTLANKQAQSASDPAVKRLYNLALEAIKDDQQYIAADYSLNPKRQEEILVDILGRKPLNKLEQEDLTKELISFDPDEPLKETYSEFAKAYDIEEKFVDTDKIEQELTKLAKARIDPLRRAGTVTEAVQNIEQLVDLFNKYGIKNSEGNAWTFKDMDYITPAVVRELRTRIKGPDGTYARTLLNNVLETMSIAKGVKNLVGPVAGGITKGAGTPQFISGKLFGAPSIESAPIDEIEQDSIPVSKYAK